jgi:uncharacterized glyoxalase superfamily protein PhnB
MEQSIAYLSFNGNSKDAMEFYECALGGEFEVMMRCTDWPMAAQIPPVRYESVDVRPVREFEAVGYHSLSPNAADFSAK